MSLREQLMKAGLASQKQAKKAEADARKREYDALRNKESSKEEQATAEEEVERIRIEKEAKREADRLRNLSIEAERHAHEARFRCAQLLRSNRLNEPRAECPYYFIEHMNGVSFVRTLRVNSYQREMLARGKFAVARADPLVDEFTLIAAHTADTLAALAPEVVVLRHPALDDAEELKVE